MNSWYEIFSTKMELNKNVYGMSLNSHPVQNLIEQLRIFIICKKQTGFKTPMDYNNNFVGCRIGFGRKLLSFQFIM